MIEFLHAVADAGKPTAAICHAGWMLISAGLVSGRRLTSFHSIRDDLVNAGAEWLDQEVVTDGNLITSRHPGDLPAFGRALVEALARAAEAAG
jgi:protease I